VDWFLLSAVFALNVVSTALSTLKTVFLVRGFVKPVYLVVLLDALTFVWGMKLVVDSEDWLFLLVFALGKTAGVWVGDVIDKKLALGILDVTIMAKREKAHRIADYLRSLGIVSNTVKTYGLNGEEKWDVRFLVNRREFDSVLRSLENQGFDNLSMVINTVDKVTGKISTSHVSKVSKV